MNKQSQSGFTLVELSIVLVIIGLIIGGILAGADMIRAAKIRSAIGEFEEYKTAVFTFKNKYGGLPGDLKNATQFWGEAAAGVACATTNSGGQETCNGDGDGTIEITSVSSVEYLRFWQQLSNANLIPQSGFSGISGLLSGYPAITVIKFNVSESNAFKGVAWNIYYKDVSAAAVLGADIFNVTNGNSFILGKITNFAQATAPAISPLDAYNIDNKVDDGKPAKGQVVAYNFSICTDAANAADTDSDYLKSIADGELCALGFINQF